MILEKILVGLFPRLPKQYIWPAITAVMLMIGVSAVWLALKAAHARELDSKDETIKNLKLEIQLERKRSDSLTVVIIVDKTNRINELAEDNRKLETKNEVVNDYVYENQLRDEINRRKAVSSNKELKRILKKKAQ